MSQRTFQRSLPSFTSRWSGTATWNGDRWPSGSCEHLSNQNCLASSGKPGASCVIVIIHCVHFGKMIVFMNIWRCCRSYSCFRTECLWKTVDKCVFRSLSFVFFSEKASGGTNSAWLWLHPLPKSQSCWGKKNSLSSSCKIGLILTSMKSRLVPVWPQHCWFLLLSFFGKDGDKKCQSFFFFKKRQDLQKLST